LSISSTMIDKISELGATDIIDFGGTMTHRFTAAA
jgi:hypothetical protein